MKLLLDANLSWRLTTILKQHFTDCFHIDQVGLQVPVKDQDLWNYAKANELIIMTNDEDFIDLIILRGFPPKVVI